MSPQQELIWNYIKKNPGCTRKDVAVFIGGSWRNRYKDVEFLILGGHIQVKARHDLYVVEKAICK